MSDSTKKVLLTIGAVVLALFAIKIVFGFVLALVYNIVIPVAVLAAIGYAVYHFVGRKALSGGRRTLP